MGFELYFMRAAEGRHGLFARKGRTSEEIGLLRARADGQCTFQPGKTTGVVLFMYINGRARRLAPGREVPVEIPFTLAVGNQGKNGKTRKESYEIFFEDENYA